MSVLLATPDPEMGGGVAHCYRVLRPHLSSGVEYLIVGARNPGERGVRCCWRVLRDYLRFYRRLRSGHYDLIHLNPSLARKAVIRDGLFLLLAKCFGKKVLVFWHGWDPACETAIRRWFLPLFRWVYFRADACIVLATQFQSVLRGFGYDKPIYLQTMVVPDDVFSLADRQRTNRARGDILNILFLSRVEKAKGIYEAIDAFRMVHEKHSSVCLTIAGDGSELESVKEYVRAQNIEGITFLGWVRGPSKLEAFAKADVYLFPTRHGEGMPNSVLEAMACRLPVITRSVGGVQDFFENGRMGFLTASKEPQVFASLLEGLVADEQLRRQMGDYNHTYAMNRFRGSQVAQRLDRIYWAVTRIPPFGANASQGAELTSNARGGDPGGAGSVQEQTDERR
jgi:glycosyltransferase involved in cell wall biosynthesis